MTPYECSKCRDEYWIIDTERNVAIPCECAARKRINHLLKHSNIGEGFRTKTFDNFIVDGKDDRIKRAYQFAKRYAAKFADIRKEPKNGLGIVGAVGSGKTHLLCAIANALLDQGVGVRYFNFITGFKEMFSKYDRGAEAVEEIRWELQTCDVLMLDDLAKGKVDHKTKRVDISKAVFDEVYTIVDYRYFNGLPIIWSSEMFQELANPGVLGEATASRLFERCHIANVTYAPGEQIGTLNHRLSGVVG